MVNALIKDVVIITQAHVAYGEYTSPDDKQPTFSVVIDLYNSQSNRQRAVINSVVITAGRARFVATLPITSYSLISDPEVFAEYNTILNEPLPQEQPSATPVVPQDTVNQSIESFGARQLSTVSDNYRQYQESFNIEDLSIRNELYAKLVKNSTREDKRTIIKNSINNYSKTSKGV